MKALLLSPLLAISLHAQPQNYLVAWQVAKWDGSKMSIIYYQDGSWPTTGWSLNQRTSTAAVGLGSIGQNHNYIYPTHTNLTVSQVYKFTRTGPKETWWYPKSAELVEYYAANDLSITNILRLPAACSFSGPDLYGTKVVVDGTTKLVRHGSLTVTLRNKSESRMRWLFKCGGEGKTWEWEEILGPDEERVVALTVKNASAKAGFKVKYFGVYSVDVAELLY